MTPPSTTPAPPPRRQALWICLLLAAVTLALYWPVTRCGFVAYDDPDFVTANPVVQAGVTLPGLRYALSAVVAYNWHPLTLLSHMLDCQLFGQNAGWHHLTSLLLHTANTLLLFLVLRRMTGALWRSALVAALFAWHPLHVESVAWIAERKDVLSALFWWLTLWAWLGYAGASKRPGAKSKLFYSLAVFLFVLAAMSKPMVVTFPFILLLLDFWPLGRFQLRPLPPPVREGRAKSRPAPPVAKSAAGLPPPWRLLLEKIPFFAISAALCAKTFLLQKHGGAMLDIVHLPLAARLGNAVISYLRYPAKMLWPENLSALYFRIGGWPDWQVAGAALLLAALTVWMVAQVRTRPWLAAGWFWYAGMLVPVIGLVQVGMQTMADRYTYLPLTGLFIILAWGGADLAVRFRPPQYVPWLAAALSLAACLFLTARQIPCWKDGETLYKKMIDVNGRNYIARYNLGTYYSGRGKFDLAIEQYRLALAVEPNSHEIHNNLAGMLIAQKHYDEAIQHFRESARLKPTPTAYCNLGSALAEAAGARHDTNLFAQSVGAFQQSLQLDPGNYYVEFNLALSYLQLNRRDEAKTHFQAALRIHPDDPAARQALSELDAPAR